MPLDQGAGFLRSSAKSANLAGTNRTRDCEGEGACKSKGEHQANGISRIILIYDADFRIMKVIH